MLKFYFSQMLVIYFTQLLKIIVNNRCAFVHLLKKYSFMLYLCMWSFYLADYVLPNRLPICSMQLLCYVSNWCKTLYRANTVIMVINC